MTRRLDRPWFMRKSRALLLGVLVVAGRAEAQTELKPELVRRAKAATALVEVTHPDAGASGTAFCVDKSGLFVTNAHVVEDDFGREGTVRLVLDIGLETQRGLPAKVLRRDDEMDLALLQVEPASGPELTALALGQEAALKELAGVVTFGFPFGKAAAVGRAQYPDMTVLPCRITSLRRDKERLLNVQFDNQLNPGNSGGPVLDGAGNVVGVARATVLGAALNMAIPVGLLGEFLQAPGLVFELPEFSFFERMQPRLWTIRVQPTQGATLLPEDLSVAVTMINHSGPRRTVVAERAGVGTFRATVAPVARDPDWPLNVSVMPAAFVGQLTMRVADDDVRGGPMQFMRGVLRTLMAGHSPRDPIVLAAAAKGSRLRLGKVTKKAAQKTTTVDFNQVEQIQFYPDRPPRTQMVTAQVEARQGTKVLATIRRRTTLDTPPEGVDLGFKGSLAAVITPLMDAAPGPGSPPRFLPVLVDDGQHKLGGMVEARAIPRGAGKSIRPPDGVAMPPARLAEGPADAPLLRKLEGKISDVATGGGGRFLFLTLKDAQKLAVFDVNAADVVKTISLPSANVLVAAGARKLVLAFPDERVVRRYNLETFEREGGTRASPIDGRLIRLAMGSDSDGPLLAMWSIGHDRGGTEQTRLSFIDLETLAVSRVGLIAARGGRQAISASGGSFTASVMDAGRMLRAAAGGAVFATGGGESRLSVGALALYGGAVFSTYEPVPCNYVCPGPDGRTLFTGLLGRLDLDCQRIGGGGTTTRGAAEVTVPSADPSYFLSIGGLAGSVTGFEDYSVPPPYHAPARNVRAAIHAADGSRLCMVHGLDEMAFEIKREDQAEWAKSPFTIDKRFVFAPAAHLLITIPAENDRLALRRLKLEEALGAARENYLFVVSPPYAVVKAGQKLEYQIVAQSNKGGITCALERGPEGLELAADGAVTWRVLQKLAGDDVTAAITVQDAAGQKRSFVLALRVE